MKDFLKLQEALTHLEDIRNAGRDASADEAKQIIGLVAQGSNRHERRANASKMLSDLRRNAARNRMNPDEL